MNFDPGEGDKGDGGHGGEGDEGFERWKRRRNSWRPTNKSTDEGSTRGSRGPTKDYDDRFNIQSLSGLQKMKSK